MSCPDCAGEGGIAGYVDREELDFMDFLVCETCNGTGASEGAVSSHNGVPSAFVDGASSPSGPLAGPEPFDSNWNRMARANEDALRRLER